ncbi:hypothetical protein F4802DRAFT_85834 [Xylaria palmicola]|nr:hypothetical protein F4802DRAFT_85834 [Xylaria palmicola]
MSCCPKSKRSGKHGSMAPQVPCTAAQQYVTKQRWVTKTRQPSALLLAILAPLLIAGVRITSPETQLLCPMVLLLTYLLTHVRPTTIQYTIHTPYTPRLRTRQPQNTRAQRSLRDAQPLINIHCRRPDPTEGSLRVFIEGDCFAMRRGNKRRRICGQAARRERGRAQNQFFARDPPHRIASQHRRRRGLCWVSCCPGTLCWILRHTDRRLPTRSLEETGSGLAGGGASPARHPSGQVHGQIRARCVACLAWTGHGPVRHAQARRGRVRHVPSHRSRSIYRFPSVVEQAICAFAPYHEDEGISQVSQAWSTPA